MAVAPAFFASQIIFFVWAAVLLAFFVKSLVDEVTLKGWRTSRTVWSCCLCVSSSIFVIDQLDPRTILGVFPPQLLKFIEWIEVITLTQSIAFAGYVYMVAMYQRNMGSVPALLRNFWLGFNVTFSLAHLILGLIGSVTDKVLWFGVSEALLVVQQLAISAVLNVAIFKLSGYLHQLTQDRTILGGTGTNYSVALRKMCFVSVYTVVIAMMACVFELAAPGHAVDNLSHPNATIFYINSTFSGLALVYPALVCFAHSLLLYMIRRPQPNSEKNTKESGSGGPRPSTTSGWRPSIGYSLPEAHALPAEHTPQEACDIIVVS